MPPKFVAVKREVCGKCAKTVYPEEEINGAGKKWHKGLCFRCHHPAGCTITLDLKNHFAFEGKVYCNTHCPRPKATTIADDVMTEHARNAPKKATEGSGAVHKGVAGEKKAGAVGGGGGGGGAKAAAATPTPAAAEPTPEPAAEPTPEPAAEPTPDPAPADPPADVPTDPPADVPTDPPADVPTDPPADAPPEEVPTE
jgi:hypothetical protein